MARLLADQGEYLDTSLTSQSPPRSGSGEQGDITQGVSCYSTFTPTARMIGPKRSISDTISRRSGSAPIWSGSGHIRRQFGEAAPQVRIGECSLERGFEALKDRPRGGSGRGDRVPDRQVESGYAGLGEGWHVRNSARSAGA